MTSGKVLRLLIAIDAEESELKLSSKKLGVLRDLIRENEVALEAVYIAPKLKKDQANSDDGKILKDELLNIIGSYHLGHVAIECTVLRAESSSQSAKANLLSQHANSKNVDLILLTSHGRTGVGRLFLGSFAENIMMHASMPVMILGELGSLIVKSGAIIYPTDFTQSSKQAFRYLLRQIEGTKARVILLYSTVIQIYDYDFGFLNFGGYLPDTYWEIHQAELIKISNTWIEEAKKYGVSASMLVDETALGRLESIETVASENQSTLLALTPEYSQGVFRELIHTQKYNVWICGAIAQQEIDQLGHREQINTPRGHPGAQAGL